MGQHFKFYRAFMCASILTMGQAISSVAQIYDADGFASQDGGTNGGKGGKVVSASTGTEINQAISGRSSKEERVIIEVQGTVNHGNTFKARVNTGGSTADGLIELKGVSNITIIGVGSGAVFDQIGIHIREAKNIVIRNVTIKNVKKNVSPSSNGGDAIGMDVNVSNVWVDHCNLEASGGEAQGYDGLFDMKSNTKYVTLSYSILQNSERGGLVGHTDGEIDNGPVTYHHNIYKNLNSRTPLLRGATAHSFNNHFNGLVESGMNPRMGGKIKVENNYVENARNPLGSFYIKNPETDKGFWEVSGNIWGDNVTWVTGEKEFPAGPDPVSNTTISIPYRYSLDKAADIRQILEKTAGVGKNLAISDGTSTPIIRAAVTKDNHSVFTGNVPKRDLLGRNLQRGYTSSHVAVTTKGLVINGLELHEIYSK